MTSVDLAIHNNQLAQERAAEEFESFAAAGLQQCDNCFFIHEQSDLQELDGLSLCADCLPKCKTCGKGTNRGSLCLLCEAEAELIFLQQAIIDGDPDVIAESTETMSRLNQELAEMNSALTQKRMS